MPGHVRLLVRRNAAAAFPKWVLAFLALTMLWHDGSEAIHGDEERDKSMADLLDGHHGTGLQWDGGGRALQPRKKTDDWWPEELTITPLGAMGPIVLLGSTAQSYRVGFSASAAGAVGLRVQHSLFYSTSRVEVQPAAAACSV